MANWTCTHSAQFGAQMPRRSPLPRPSAGERARGAVDVLAQLAVGQPHALVARRSARRGRGTRRRRGRSSRRSSPPAAGWCRFPASTTAPSISSSAAGTCGRSFSAGRSGDKRPAPRTIRRCPGSWRSTSTRRCSTCARSTRCSSARSATRRCARSGSPRCSSSRSSASITGRDVDFTTAQHAALRMVAERTGTDLERRRRGRDRRRDAHAPALPRRRRPRSTACARAG